MRRKLRNYKHNNPFTNAGVICRTSVREQQIEKETADFWKRLLLSQPKSPGDAVAARNRMCEVTVDYFAALGGIFLGAAIAPIYR
jgi:hypothetical protein